MSSRRHRPRHLKRQLRKLRVMIREEDAKQGDPVILPSPAWTSHFEANANTVAAVSHDLREFRLVPIGPGCPTQIHWPHNAPRQPAPEELAVISDGFIYRIAMVDDTKFGVVVTLDPIPQGKFEGWIST